MVKTRPHQEAAIGPAPDGQLVLAGVLVVDEELGGRDEVVKAILLIMQSAGVMPFFAVFAAPSNIGDRVMAVMLYEK